MSSLLALTSSLFWGSGDFLGGTLSRRLNPVVVVAWSQAIALAFFAAVALATGGWRDDLGYWPAAIGAGIAGPIGLVAFYAALSSGTMGVVAPIAALGVVVPVTAGVIAGDRPSSIQIIGILVAGVGAVLSSGPELRGAAGPKPVALAALAGLCFGFALLFLAWGSEVSPLMTLVGMRTTSTVLFVVVAVAVRSVGTFSRRDLPLLATVGLLDGAANLTYALATATGLLSVVAVLASLYPAVTVLLARVFHHERMTAVQNAGVVMALAGVVAIAAG